ncbi:MAG TPA: NPCBM/NEW2 domain-containing protein [Anaerohalosphaeraceae bacterium]|nr:NPCBM/NEW2 domain-containing protein [Anaerohalosphaeraceae bacterium]
MTYDRQKKIELGALLSISLEGELNEEQNHRMNELLCDPELRGHYFKLLSIVTALRGIQWESLRPEIRGDCDKILDKRFWDALAESENTCPGIMIEKEQIRISPKPAAISRIDGVSQKTGRKYYLYASSIIAASFLFIILYVCFLAPPPLQVVATLTDSIGAKWSNESASMTIGSRLNNTVGSLWLQRGLARITFEYGAEVIIEAPAEFRLIRPDRMALYSGRLYAKVPEHATGFTVDTNCSSVIDLGTEFGVKVDVDGTTDVIMLKGKASLLPGPDGKKMKGQVLGAGDSRRVTMAGLVQDIKTPESNFVSYISSRTGVVLRGNTLSLADIVGGGDGTGTGMQGRGINPSNGMAVSENNAGYINYPVSFAVVDDNPLVDAVFVPGGQQGNVRISSTNEIFSGLPITNGKCCSDIMNQKGPILFNGTKRHLLPAILNGNEYGTENERAIYIHSNSGITFDLAAIRGQFDNTIRIIGFKSVCGALDGLDNYGNPKIDFWVLIDGQERFKRMGLQSKSMSADIDLILTGKERYLTLIVTDGGDSYEADLGLFGNPVLVLSHETK